MLDRALGLFGLFLVSTFVILLSFPYLLHLDSEHRSIQIGSYMVGMGSIVGILILLFIELRKKLMSFRLVAGTVAYGKKRIPTPLASWLERLILALEIFGEARAAIGLAVFLSFGVHSLSALNVFCIGASLGENSLGLRDYFLAVSVANAISAIPVTPGGIGTRDATIALFFSSMGASTENAVAVPIMMSFIIIFWGLLGGIIFVFFKLPRHLIRRLVGGKEKKKCTHS